VTTFDTVRTAIFIAATLGLIIISRRALFKFRSHGFFRFIAWEAILALIVWNLPFWFAAPLSINHLLAWIVLFASLFVLWRGVSLLRTGKPTAKRSESELYQFEKTSELVTSGIFRYIRHPLYASLMYLSWGAFLKDVSWISFTLMVIACVSLVATAKADEKECIQYFGAQYEQYMKRTKMFVPYLF